MRDSAFAFAQPDDQPGPTSSQHLLRKRARYCLLILAAVVLVAQPVSALAASRVASALEQGKDTATQWRHYVTSPPEVLLIGDSRVRADVDTASIESILASWSGRRIRVGKLGISGASPALLDAITYDVTHMSHKPSRVVIAISEYEFNANYNPDDTYNFWQISFPNAGFVATALRLDWNKGRLVRGWLVPTFANAQTIVQGVACWVQEIQGVPLCSQVSRFPEDQVMTPAKRDYILDLYHDLHLFHYKFSMEKLSYLREAVQRLKSDAVQVHLLVLPIYRIDAIDPSGYSDFENEIGKLALELHVGVTDLHHAMQGNLENWGDPSHLNHQGASKLAPQLAAIVASPSNRH